MTAADRRRRRETERAIAEWDAYYERLADEDERSRPPPRTCYSTRRFGWCDGCRAPDCSAEIARREIARRRRRRNR